jgi:hypothetical protein
MTGISTLVLAPASWLLPEDDTGWPAYRCCDLCQEDAVQDVLAGKAEAEFREFWTELTDGARTLDICEHCLGLYLEEKP